MLHELVQHFELPVADERCKLGLCMLFSGGRLGMYLHELLLTWELLSEDQNSIHIFTHTGSATLPPTVNATAAVE